MTSVHDEDEILNIPGDDDGSRWNEFDDLDEDNILGDDAYSNVAVKPEDEDDLGTTSPDGETVALQPIEETDPDDILDYNEEEEDAKTPIEDEGDDESEDEESGRDKFRSERAATSTAPMSRAIPDSLDDVQLKPETFAACHNGRGRGRGGRVGQQKVLINPRYRGSVTQQPNIRLRWDSSQMPMIQMGAVRVVPSRPIIPTASNIGLAQRFNLMNQRVGLFPGPPPSFGRVPMPLMAMSTVAPVRLFPQPSRPFMTSLPPPSNILHQTLSNAFSQPPPRLGGGIVRPQQTDLAAYARLTSASSGGPRPSVSSGYAGGAGNDGNWDRMVEDFVNRTSRQRSTMDHRQSRTDRSRSPLPRRRVRSKSPDDSQRSTSPHDRNGRRRLPTDQAARNEARSEKPNPAAQKVDVESARAIGLDDEYLVKMEEQKRLRETMVRRKEQRRIQEMKKKQDEQSVPATQRTSAIVNKAAADVAVVPQQQRQASQAKKTMNQRKGPAPSDSAKETAIERQVILPSHKMSAVISEASKPILRTIVNRKIKPPPPASDVNVERRAVAGQGVPTPPPLRIPIAKAAAVANASKQQQGDSTPPARISIHERFSSSQFKQREPVGELPPAKKAKKPTVSIAAVVRDISGWDGALGRLTLVAGTVGNVKKCWKSANDTVSIIFEDQDKAINFQQQYNSKVMSGIKLIVKLEPVTDLDS